MTTFASAVRLAARGLDTPRSEAMPWEPDEPTTVVVVDEAGVEIAGSPFDTVVVADEFGDRCEYTLPSRADLGTLTETWTDGRQEWVAEVEVRGGDSYPRIEIERRLASGSETSVTVYPEWMRRIACSDALLVLEGRCETALVPKRSTVEIWEGGSGNEIDLDPLAHLIAVVATDAPGITPSACRVKPGGTVVLPSVVSAPLTLTVDHGDRGPAPDVSLAIAAAAAARLMDGAWDERGYAQIGEGGNYLRLLTAGIGGAEFSQPECEIVFKRYRMLRVS